MRSCECSGSVKTMRATVPLERCDGSVSVVERVCRQCKRLLRADVPYEHDREAQVAVEEAPNGLTLDAIAEILGISYEQAYRAYEIGLRKLSRHRELTGNLRV